MTSSYVVRGGYDHSLLRERRDLDTPMIELTDPGSGRRLSVTTDASAVHLYSGNSLPQLRTGLSLETQGLPDAPNRLDFPSTVL
jgi:aldose 1-epimerase